MFLVVLGRTALVGQGSVQANRCIGCGFCVITCPSESITLVERAESERDEIAEDMINWGKRRLADREGQLE